MHVQVGAKGNLLDVDVGDLEDSEGLLAGPPCTPCANNGHQHGIYDERSDGPKSSTELWIGLLNLLGEEVSYGLHLKTLSIWIK